MIPNLAEVRETNENLTFLWKGTEFLFKKDGRFQGWSRIRPCDPLEAEIQGLRRKVEATEKALEILGLAYGPLRDAALRAVTAKSWEDHEITKAGLRKILEGQGMEVPR